jgi:hypothetical protein
VANAHHQWFRSILSVPTKTNGPSERASHKSRISRLGLIKKERASCSASPSWASLGGSGPLVSTPQSTNYTTRCRREGSIVSPGRESILRRRSLRLFRTSLSWRLKSRPKSSRYAQYGIIKIISVDYCSHSIHARRPSRMIIRMSFALRIRSSDERPILTHSMSHRDISLTMSSCAPPLSARQ